LAGPASVFAAHPRFERTIARKDSKSALAIPQNGLFFGCCARSVPAAARSLDAVNVAGALTLA